MTRARPFRIRRAQAADLPQLVEMMAAFNREEGIAWRPRKILPALRELLRDRRLGCVIVSEDGDNCLQGYAIATFGYDLEYAGRDSFLTELFVRPARRGAGEGRRLLLAITEQMRKDGAAAMHLAVWPTNRRARRLYESVGFDRLRRVVLTRRLARGKSSTITF